LDIEMRISTRGIRGRWLFLNDLVRYRKAKTPHAIPITSLYPIYRDRFKAAAGFSDYFHQDLWAARKIFETRPARHVDVGSRIDGFVAQCLTFMDVEVVDIRPLSDPPRGMIFRRADAVHMTGFADDSVPSLSSLNVAEHFGLGRYGDKIDPDAHVTFMKSLQRVLAPGGKLYFSVPLSGHERVEFNAHRVLSPTTVTNAFDRVRLVSFSIIKDDGRMYEDTEPSVAMNQRFGCGLFEFAKDV
jgi:hypothetical protein